MNELSIIIFLIIIAFLATIIIRLKQLIKKQVEEKEAMKVSFEKEIRELKKDVAEYLYLNKTTGNH